MAITSISANDAEATPVAHVFTHLTSATDQVQWHNLPTDGIASSAERLTLGIRRARTGPDGKMVSGNNRVIVNLSDPTMETISSTGTSLGYEAVPRVAHVNRAKLEIVLSPNATAQERDNILEVFKNILSNSQVVDAVTDLAPPS